MAVIIDLWRRAVLYEYTDFLKESAASVFSLSDWVAGRL
jgi:hypothetical protein